MALAFHDLLRNKSDQVASLLGAMVSRCLDPNFQDTFQVEKIDTESKDIRTKHIRGVNSIMNKQPIPMFTSYDQLTTNHILSHGLELKSLHLDIDSD